MAVEFKVGKSGDTASISSEKKSITIAAEKKGIPVITVINEYGNSVRYEISEKYQFDSLWEKLRQFIKDSEH